jgi:Na+-translocating membrane potential-generating system MpsC-like protein
MSNSIVAMLCAHDSRGPINAQPYVLDDTVVVLHGRGFIALEKTIGPSRTRGVVIVMREDLRRVMASRCKQMIERLTGRNVAVLDSGVQVEPDITLENLFIDGPLRGFDALEIIEHK